MAFYDIYIIFFYLIQLTAVHTELKKTMDDLLRLERLLSDNKKEIQEKEEMLSQMDRYKSYLGIIFIFIPVQLQLSAAR